MIAKLRLAAALCLVPASAWADDVATAEDVCEGRALGSDCTYDGGRGVCRETKCEGIDYSSGKPVATERSCRRCVSVATKDKAPDEPAKTDAKPDAKVDAKPDAKAEPEPTAVPEPTPDAKAVPAAVETPAAPAPTKATVVETKTAAAVEAKPATDAKDKGCTIEPAPASLASFALGLGLLALARRRSVR